jgi:hypothetical protein
MKRIIIALTLLVLVALAATSCSALSATSTTPDEGQLPARFVVLDDKDLGDYQSAIQVHNDNTSQAEKDNTTAVRFDDMQFVVDRVTRVVYIFLDDTDSRYSGMVMTPLYNTDGTVVIYEGELPQVLYNN